MYDNNNIAKKKNQRKTKKENKQTDKQQKANSVSSARC